MPGRILIVDDTSVMRSVLKDILLDNGFEIVGEAGDGQEAARVYAQVRPDLVMMDIVMPDVTGLDGLEAILEADPAARVIMCTADRSRDAVMAALRAGAKDFVIKPFNVERLLQAVNKALAG